MYVLLVEMDNLSAVIFIKLCKTKFQWLFNEAMTPLNIHPLMMDCISETAVHISIFWDHFSLSE